MVQNLPWDHPENPYRPFLIWEYSLWVLLLNEKQGYVGRSYAWLKRDGKIGYTDLSQDELLELHLCIMPGFEVALTMALGYDRDVDLVNYAWLANHEAHGHHGHLHMIPRFKVPRCNRALGIWFGGERWGQNYVPDPKVWVAPEVYERTRKLIADHLPR